MSTPLVSVLMPTCNRADILPETLGTILSQEGDFELVILDNGSTDATPRIIEEAQLRDPRVRALRNNFNRGVVPVHNQAMRQARGKYTMYSGDDDLWTANRFAVLLNHLDESLPLPVVYTDWILLDTERRPLPYNTEEEVYPPDNASLENFGFFAHRPDFRLAFALFPTSLFADLTPFVALERDFGSCADAVFASWINLHGNVRRVQEVTIHKLEMAKKDYKGTHKTADKPELVKWLKHLWLVYESARALPNLRPLEPHRQELFLLGLDEWLLGYLHRSLTWTPPDLAPAMLGELTAFAQERGYLERLPWVASGLNQPG